MDKDDTEILTGKITTDMSSHSDSTLSSTALLSNDRGSVSMKFISVAFVGFFLSVAHYLSDTIQANVVESQYCLAVLHVQPAICLNSSSVYIEEVQQFTSSFSMLRSISIVVIRCLMLIFLGAWSDIYGRKMLMILPTTGYLITCYLWTLGSTVPTLNPMFFLFFDIPTAIGGGLPMLVFSANCIICDETPKKYRGFRLGTLLAVFSFGSFVGSCSCYFVQQHGFIITFICATALAHVSVFCACCYSNEPSESSRVQVDVNDTNQPFRLKYLKETFDACCTNLTSNKRLLLLSIMFIYTLSHFEDSAIGTNLRYLYLQRILKWNLSQYTVFVSFSILAHGIGLAGGAWLFCSKLEWRDLEVLALIDCLQLCSLLIFMFAFQSWHIFFAKFLDAPHALFDPLAKSLASKVVSNNELGKIFSVMTIWKSVAEFISSMMLTGLYKATLDVYPEAIYGLTSIFVIIILFTLTFMIKLVQDREGIDAED